MRLGDIWPGQPRRTDAPRCPVSESLSHAAWFAGSQVVDEAGAPLVVYHGSDRDFARFEPGHKNGMTLPRRGFYFTDNLQAAREFGRVHGYHLAIRRPADFRHDGGQTFVDQALAYNNGELADWYQAAVHDRYGAGGATVGRLARMGLLQPDDFLEALAGIGCDGMFFDDDFAGHSFTSFVAFDAAQIKRLGAPTK